MTSPYSGLPPQSFWRTGVSEQHPLSATGLYRRKYAISQADCIATAGSCFAQHIATHFRKHGFNVLDAEPAPPGLDPEQAKDFGYGTFSARYANIYCIRQMLQLAREAYGEFSPADAVWQKSGRFYDAMRPAVEPEGLDSAEAVMRHRKRHLQAVRKVLEESTIFVFTFGLTEAWTDRESGTVYPTAPGTVAGTYDPGRHVFRNFTFQEIYQDFLEFRALVRSRNPSVRFMLTVSPVPLTATASPDHVLVATTYSKSVLRAVAGQLFQEHEDIDYFPSYEIIASPFSRGMFYEPNLRAVNPGGVEIVMRTFFTEHAPASEPVQPRQPAREKPHRPGRKAAGRNKDDVVCEDALLEAFAR